MEDEEKVEVQCHPGAAHSFKAELGGLGAKLQSLDVMVFQLGAWTSVKSRRELSGTTGTR